MTGVETFLAEKARKTEAAMAAFVDSWEYVPEVLLEAIRYSLFAGGKRLRPGLTLGAAEIIAGDDTAAMPAACAIEMVHTYSLIHDDLPSMDDDDLRRGRPTLHKVYGEATAILAGDGLFSMAFDLLAETGRADVVREIARAAGVSGMVGGQILDLQSEGKPITLEALQRIHRAKTGALFRASVRSGALIAGADAARLDALTAYGEHVGLAFQIVDDILDVIGDAESLGKSPGSDNAQEKATYPGVAGLDHSRQLAKEAADSAIAALSDFGPEAEPFRDLARFMIERRH